MGKERGDGTDVCADVAGRKLSFKSGGRGLIKVKEGKRGIGCISRYMLTGGDNDPERRGGGRRLKGWRRVRRRDHG